MQFLASCSIDESKNYSGKLVIPSEDGSKPDTVVLNILAEDGTDVFKELSGSEKCVTCKKSPPYCPTELVGKLFVEYTLDSFDEDLYEEMGVIPLIVLEKDFCNMKTLFDINKVRTDVRFIGGNLLVMEGVNLGRFESNPSKNSVVLSGMYDSFAEIQLCDLDNLEVISSKRKNSKVAKALEAVEKSKKKGKKEKVQVEKVTTVRSKMKDSLGSLFGC